MRVLVIPAESHPCHHSFLEEVFSRPPADVEVTFLMRAREGAEGSNLTWNEARVTAFAQKPSSRALRALKTYATDLRYVPRVFRSLRSQRPDVVFVRDMTFPFFLAMLLRPFFRHAVVFQKSFPNELRWFDPVWVHAHRLPWLWSFCRHVENGTLHRLMREADAVVPISRWMADELHETWRIRRALLHPFGLGLSRRDASIAYERNDRSTVEFVYTGTMGRTRQLEVLLDAFAHLVDRRPEVEARLTMIGGEPGDVERLREHARRRRLDRVVRFTGSIPRRAVYERLREHDVGVVYIPKDPRFRVACPTKLVECLAIGLPVVSTDACALNAVLAEQNGGVVLTDDSVDGFAAGLVEFVDRRLQWTASARQGRGEILEEYDYDVIRNRMMDLLRGLVSDSRSTSSSKVMHTGKGGSRR